MITVENLEAIRRAYYLEHKSIRQIAHEQHHSGTKTQRRKAFSIGQGKAVNRFGIGSNYSQHLPFRLRFS